MNESFEMTIDKNVDPNTPVKDVMNEKITITMGDISHGQARLLIKANPKINIKRTELKDDK